MIMLIYSEKNIQKTTKKIYKNTQQKNIIDIYRINENKAKIKLNHLQANQQSQSSPHYEDQ